MPTIKWSDREGGREFGRNISFCDHYEVIIKQESQHSSEILLLTRLLMYSLRIRYCHIIVGYKALQRLCLHEYIVMPSLNKYYVLAYLVCKYV